jgi:hypothetical protein
VTVLGRVLDVAARPVYPAPLRRWPCPTSGHLGGIALVPFCFFAFCAVEAATADRKSRGRFNGRPPDPVFRFTEAEDNRLWGRFGRAIIPCFDGRPGNRPDRC